ncbi:hypothetical protein E3P92_02381 [Wallemia ichthyophaga]|uniref:Uncharacterized protein n=1 Tax=Wallemia ichthyophaga (strain EXF-994 / CBS 113033) TaxID=1299270 RepID=R9AL25_WALI9|nr:uncharacterized protein J056_003474 [Wallemia ichthyophaga EXF-994]TIA71784.1 hypothetical protein E3P91_02393 [Wallemia ichthyophaga]EOR02912.1 hypothetical protein J056_003474 [Wallemia ichthyophaga EXF-994]TIA90871.1 hypothetical protein E3P97_02322 [Wallemia ichthyophaga]TIA99816.1 hypothetical protein E3P95_01946 [Wallemia ichthyophaga]TIB00790.1 hypothetical protein E3P94_02070 [Wallemia ichthyophaga]
MKNNLNISPESHPANKIDSLVERNNQVLERARALANSTPSRTPSRASNNHASSPFSPSPLSASVASSRTSSAPRSNFDMRSKASSQTTPSNRLSISSYAKSRRAQSPPKENEGSKSSSFKRRSRIPRDFFDQESPSSRITRTRSNSIASRTSFDSPERVRPSSRVTTRTSMGTSAPDTFQPFPASTTSHTSHTPLPPSTSSNYRRQVVSSLNDLESGRSPSINSRPVRHSTSTSLEGAKDGISRNSRFNNRPSLGGSEFRPATSMAFSSSADSQWSPQNHRPPPLTRGLSRSSNHLRSQSALDFSPDRPVPLSRSKNRSPLLENHEILRSPTKLTPASSKRLETLANSLKSLQMGLSRLDLASSDEADNSASLSVKNMSKASENIHKLHAQALEFLLRAETENTLFSNPENVEDCRLLHDHAKNAQRAADELVRDLTDTLVGMSRLVRDLSGSQSPSKTPNHSRASSVNAFVPQEQPYRSRLDDIRSHRPNSTTMESRRSSFHSNATSPSPDSENASRLGYRPRSIYLSNHHRSVSGSSTNTIKNSYDAEVDTIRPSPRMSSPEKLPSESGSGSSLERRPYSRMSTMEGQPSIVRSLGKSATTAVTRENAHRRLVQEDELKEKEERRRSHRRSKPSLSRIWPWNNNSY